MGRRLRSIVVSLQLVGLLAWPAGAAGNALDPTFSGDGRALIHVEKAVGAYDAAAAPHHKIVVLADSYKKVFVVRYLADGRLDGAFGTNGSRALDLLHIGSELTGKTVAVGPHGAIVVMASTASGTSPHSVVARLLPNGKLDPRFGGDGTVHVDGLLTSIAVQTDGAVVGAESQGVIRLSSDGSKDPSFGTGGLASTDFHADWVTLIPNGDLVVSGTHGSNCGEGGCDITVMVERMLSNGSPDPTFGTNGEAEPPISDGNCCDTSVVAAPDGKTVVAANSGGAAIARLNPDGTTDHSFSGDGVFVSQKFAYSEDPFDMRHVAVLQDGGVASAVPTTPRGTPFAFRLLRLTAAGNLDETFGNDGVMTTTFGGGPAISFAVIALPNGKVVAVGQPKGGGALAVARFLSR